MNRFFTMKKISKCQQSSVLLSTSTCSSGNPKNSSKYHFQKSMLIFFSSESQLRAFGNFVVGDFLSHRKLKQLLLFFLLNHHTSHHLEKQIINYNNIRLLVTAFHKKNILISLAGNLAKGIKTFCALLLCVEFLTDHNCHLVFQVLRVGAQKSFLQK